MMTGIRRLFLLLLPVGLVAAGCGDEAVTTHTITDASSSAPVPTSPEVLAAFSIESIEPGAQQAYSFMSGSGGEQIEYLLYLPESYQDDRDWPLIVSLHGFLGTDQTLESVRTKNPLAWVDPNVEFPFVLVAPKAPNGPWSLIHEPMTDLFDVLGDSLSIDQDAFFLTGLSAGAVGVWQWALDDPELFAGIAPVAGGPSMSPDNPVPDDICRLVDLPIWVAHGENDEHLPIESIGEVVAALEDCGNTTIRFNAYQNLNHIESIGAAYAGPDLYEWMVDRIP